MLRKIFLFLLAFAFSSAVVAAGIDITDDEGRLVGVTSLMSAAINNDVEGVSFFVRTDPASINRRNYGGASALHLAARQGNFAIAEILVKSGAKVDIADNEGWTPLMRAASNANAQIVKLLIDAGADATKKNSINESAIITSVAARCDECLNAILTSANFSGRMDEKILKQQLSDAYKIAQNHEDQKTQDILNTYLNSISKPVIAEPVENKPAVLVPVVAPALPVAMTPAPAPQFRETPLPQSQPVVRFRFVQGEVSKANILNEKPMLPITPMPVAPVVPVVAAQSMSPKAPTASEVVKVLQDQPVVNQPISQNSMPVKKYIFTATPDEAMSGKEVISLQDEPNVFEEKTLNKPKFKFKKGKPKLKKAVVAKAVAAPANVVVPASTTAPGKAAVTTEIKASDVIEISPKVEAKPVAPQPVVPSQVKNEVKVKSAIVPENKPSVPPVATPQVKVETPAVATAPIIPTPQLPNPAAPAPAQKFVVGTNPAAK